MSVKTTGAEFKRFYEDKSIWKDGAYHEDETITIDGVQWDYQDDLSTVADEAVMTISGGTVFLKEGADDGPSFEGLFRKWRNAQTMRIVSVELPIDKLGPFAEALKAFGGKVL